MAFRLFIAYALFLVAAAGHAAEWRINPVLKTFSAADGWSSDRNPRLLGDVNGDGRQDIVGFADDGVYLSLASGSGFDSPRKVLSSFTTNTGGWSVANHPRLLGDVNGDGRDDIVGFASGGVYYSLSTGSGFATPKLALKTSFGYSNGWRVSRHPRLLSDVNNDGRVDIVGFANGGAYVSLSTGTAFAKAYKVSDIYGYSSGWRVDRHPRYMADVTGDGVDDIVGFANAGVYVAVNDGKGRFAPAKQWINAYGYNAGGWRVESTPRLMADVNGDKRADVVGFATGGVYVSFSKGAGFAAPRLMVRDYGLKAGGWQVDRHPRYMADVNGDGRDDIVGFGNAGTFVSLSKGTAFAEPELILSAMGYAQGWQVNTHPRRVADLDNDGKADILGFGPKATERARQVVAIASDGLRLDQQPGSTTVQNTEGNAPYLSSMPVLVDRGFETAVVNRYFDGFIYPAMSGAQSSAIAQLPRFELDAPIATNANPQRQYFAFGLSLATPTPGDIRVSIAPGTTLVHQQSSSRQLESLQEVTGPCGNDQAQAQRDFMHGIAHRNTGVRSWAAYNSLVDRQLSSGQGVFWKTCQALPSLTPSRLDTGEKTHIAVLIPSSKIGSGATIEIRTSRGNGTVSPAMSMALVPSPLFIASVGDSVAWGQGLLPQEKYNELFRASLGNAARLFQFAHSGAHTGYFDPDENMPPQFQQDSFRALARPNITHAFRQLGSPNDFCNKDRDVSGEVPRRDPTTQCQIARSALMLCDVANPNSPQIRFRCTSNEPAAGQTLNQEIKLQPFPGERASDNALRIDTRARYDYVLLSSCINDINAAHIAFGGDDSGEELEQLMNEVFNQCDLRRGLGDLRVFYPNAVVAITGYHRYASQNTFRRFCSDRELLSAQRTWVNSDGAGLMRRTSPGRWTARIGGSVLAEVDNVVDNAVAVEGRIGHFIREANNVRIRSMRALNVDDRPGGRGQVVHVPLNFRPDEAMFGENAKVFGFDCDINEIDRDAGIDDLFDLFVPEDLAAIASHRLQSCADYAGFDGDELLPRLSCERASAFHPNTLGARKVFQRLREVLQPLQAFETQDGGLTPGRLLRID